MLQWLDQFLAVRGLAPHGYCLLWDPALIWTHVISDGLIAAAYFSIPIVLWRLLRVRRDIQFSWMLSLFAIFILACGMTHVMGIITLWIPAYGWEALIKVVTAVASVATAILLIPLLPKLAAIPSPAALAKANEALLREAQMREQTETMLRQSQKMEAIGQLTGGIAHDFNNILSIVILNLDRATRKSDDPAEVQRAVQNALLGAERGEKLVSQLLAFGRQQPLKVQPHDVNEIIANFCPMLEQTLGTKVRVETDLHPNLPLIRIDQSQLENALLNLAINARDAMDGEGRLTITSRPHCENMLEICVADTGCGMDAETVQRATDPFFTTKAIGKGSGLGLSQVLGTVQQLEGRLEISSTKGTGTQVRLFLPIHIEGGIAGGAQHTTG